jgi:hypothetical protein
MPIINQWPPPKPEKRWRGGKNEKKPMRVMGRKPKWEIPVYSTSSAFFYAALEGLNFEGALMCS